MIPKWFFDDSRPGILRFHYDSIATIHCYVMHRNKRSIVVILKFYSQEKWNPQMWFIIGNCSSTEILNRLRIAWSEILVINYWCRTMHWCRNHHAKLLNFQMKLNLSHNAKDTVLFKEYPYLRPRKIYLTYFNKRLICELYLH